MLNDVQIGGLHAPCGTLQDAWQRWACQYISAFRRPMQIERYGICRWGRCGVRSRIGDWSHATRHTSAVPAARGLWRINEIEACPHQCRVVQRWLIPLCLSVRFYLDFQRLELWPTVAGRPVLNSFPCLSASSTLFTLACVWLGVVILYWNGRAWASSRATST